MNWLIIVGAIFFISGICCITTDFTAFLGCVLIGCIFLYFGAKKKGFFSKKHFGSHTLIEEKFRAAGVSYYEDNIQKLANVNPDWKLSVSQIVSLGKSDKKVFHYNYLNKPVKLVHEPENPNDRNAIAIYIAGELVGYISREDNTHVLDILNHHEVKVISSFIGGGEYKIVSDDKNISKFSSANNVNICIRYVK